MSHDEAYQAVLTELARLTEAWHIHRDVVNRAISLLNHEVIGFKDRLDNDDKARETRQTQVDAALESIKKGQDRIRRWQYIRIAVEAAAILVVIAFWLGGR